jgi:hypothetical protein
MLNNLWPDVSFTFLLAAALGCVTAFVLAYYILRVLYETVWEIACAFARACSFTRFRFKVGAAQEKPRKFKFKMFFSAWWHMLGWQNGSQTITLQGGQFKGYNNYTVFGKFVSPKYVPDQFQESDDLELDEEDAK